VAVTSTLLENKGLRFFLHWFARVVLFAMRWKVNGRLPQTDKFVMIAAPHSSNWDFVIFMLVVFKFKIPVHWMGKHTLFTQPFRRLLIRLGGIPIDRSVAGDTVSTMARAFDRYDRLILTIAPSGTRSRTTTWKTGFYHIARKANVPVVCGYIDYRHKIAGVGPTFHPTGDMDTDIQAIQQFYQPFSGKPIRN
jgi:1-acyl-sn-glycerol-3-phosphate acyltransferase